MERTESRATLGMAAWEKKFHENFAPRHNPSPDIFLPQNNLERLLGQSKKDNDFKRLLHKLHNPTASPL